MMDFIHRQISASDSERSADCTGNNEETGKGDILKTIYGIFPYDYKIDKLKNLCVTQGGIQTGPFGSQLHQEDYVDVGTPIITVEHLGENRITHNNIPKVSNADKNRLAKYSLESGDIVFSRVGSVDRRALIRSAEEGWLFSGRCLRVRPDSKKLDSGYLSYFFGIDSFKEYIRSIAVGATMPSLNTAILRDIEIAYPQKLPEQRRIAHILGTLDDKIENNRKTAKTLEAMAQAIFQSWFVDFDPVRAKMAGESKESICKRLKLTPEILDLFPDRLVDSELGEIPEGWEVEKLSTLFDFMEGPGIRNWQYTNTDQGTRFINIRCIKDGDLSIETANRITNKEANGKYEHFHLREWDVVVSTSGTLGRTGIVRKEHLPLMLNTSVIRFRPIKNKMQFGFLYQYLNSVEFLAKLESLASGSVQKNFGPVHLKQIELLYPPIHLIIHYETICRSLLERMIQSRSQNDFLSQLRNILLPKLISGEIRVPETSHDEESNNATYHG